MKKPERFSTETLLKALLKLAIALITTGIFVLAYYFVLPASVRVLNFIGAIAFPFLFAWFISSYAKPMVAFLTRKLRFPRFLSAIIVILVIMSVIVIAVSLILARVATEIAKLGQYLPLISNQLTALYNTLYDIFVRLDLDPEQLNGMFTGATDLGGSAASYSLGKILGIVKGTPTAFIVFFVTIVATFYWIRDDEKMRRAIIRISPKSRHAQIGETYDAISNVFGGYMRAQTVLVGISIVIFTIGFFILRVEGAFTLGLVTGVLDIIPVLGPGTLVVPWAIINLLTGNYILGIGLLILYTLFTVQRHIMEPKLVGDRIGLHPLLTLAAIFIGFRMFGILGLIIGPILLAIIFSVFRMRK